MLFVLHYNKKLNKEMQVLTIKKWSREVEDFVVALFNDGSSYKEIAKKTTEKYDNYYSRSCIQHKLGRLGILGDATHEPKVSTEVHKQQTNNDGSINSSITEQVKERKNLTQEELLKIHHFDPKCWIVLRVISNEWTVISGQDTRYNFQSKIQVAPAKIDMDSLVDRLASYVTPFTGTPHKLSKEAENYAVYPLFDLHFDGKHNNMYQSISDSLCQLASKEPHKKSIIILGGDMFHIDSISSTTTKGTQLETVRVDDMLDEALSFMEPFISAVYDNSKDVHIISVAGNHDYMSGYFLARILKEFYKDYDISWDIDLYSHYKADLVGHNMICATHGDKGKNNYVSIFASKFPTQWASSNNRELFTGHLHSQVEKDLGGLIQRQEPTIKSDANDQWTLDNGFISRKGIITYEYSEDCVTDSHFISQPNL